MLRPAGLLPSFPRALDTPLGPSDLSFRLGSASGRFGAYPDGTCTGRINASFRTHHAGQFIKACRRRSPCEPRIGEASGPGRKPLANYAPVAHGKPVARLSRCIRRVPAGRVGNSCARGYDRASGVSGLRTRRKHGSPPRRRPLFRCSQPGLHRRGGRAGRT